MALGVPHHEKSCLNDQLLKTKKGTAFRAQKLMEIIEKYEWSRSAEKI